MARKPVRKHVPMRTCIACRQTLPKRELIRVVRTPEGEVFVDPTGKRAGRGAYLCRQAGCWRGSLKKRIVEHALKASLSEEQWEALTAFASSLPLDKEQFTETRDGVETG